MKTRMIIIVSGLILIAGLLVLNYTGILPWQKILIIFAAIVAPLRHLSSWLKGSGEKIAEVEAAHKTVRRAEAAFRNTNEAQLAHDRAKIETINTQITDINKQKETLDAERLEAHKILQNVSDEELLKAVKKTLGQQ